MVRESGGVESLGSVTELLTAKPLGWKNIERFLKLAPCNLEGQRGCFWNGARSGTNKGSFSFPNPFLIAFNGPGSRRIVE